MKSYKFFIIILMILFESSIFAATYYVSPTGSDSYNGTINNPWKTLNYAFSRITAGDILYLRGGTYKINKTLTLRYNGTLEAPITISGYKNEKVIIDGEYSVVGSEGNHIIYIKNKNSIILRNFTVTRSPHIGIIVANSTHITLEHLTITHTRASGIWFINGSDSKILNNEINECTEWGQDESISVVHSDHVEVAYNHVHHNGNNGNMNSNVGYHWNGIGIDIKNGCNYIDVHHNHVHDVESNGIYIDARGNTSYIKIYNNKVYNCAIRGNCITMANEASSGDRIEYIYIYNNIVWNGVNGINVGYGSMPPNVFHNVYIVNNVSYGNKYNGLKLTTEKGSTNIIVANNIFRNNGSKDAVNENGGMYGIIMESNNLSKTNGMVGTNYSTDDPLFVNEAFHDFHLQSSSPLVEAGTNKYFVPSVDHDDNTRSLVSKPSLGAYEKVSSQQKNSEEGKKEKGYFVMPINTSNQSKQPLMFVEEQ